jgi:hypothetical protein
MLRKYEWLEVSIYLNNVVLLHLERLWRVFVVDAWNWRRKVKDGSKILRNFS